VDRSERERIMWEGGVGDANPVEHRDSHRLAEDLQWSPLQGKPLPRRLRNFRPDAANYLVSVSGPPPYMQRLQAIERETARHERRLEDAWSALADKCGADAVGFAARWRRIAQRWRFDDVNDLIERHNRHYPIEARLPMDPRTGDFVRVGGERYERRPLEADWILARFPSKLARAA
jgi:hypothetical protein